MKTHNDQQEPAVVITGQTSGRAAGTVILYVWPESALAFVHNGARVESNVRIGITR